MGVEVVDFLVECNEFTVFLAEVSLETIVVTYGNDGDENPISHDSSNSTLHIEDNTLQAKCLSYYMTTWDTWFA